METCYQYVGLFFPTLVGMPLFSVSSVQFAYVSALLRNQEKRDSSVLALYSCLENFRRGTLQK
jgi:hypothetical protein